jgi:hypothetical protein
MATIDYMIASYGPYSASATGGNGFARDFLAGIAAMYSVPSKWYLYYQTKEMMCIITHTLQCTATWARPIRSSGPRHFWDSWLSYLRSQSISSTGKGQPSGRDHHSHKYLQQTGRRPDARSLNVELVTRTLCSVTCPVRPWAETNEPFENCLRV